MKKISAENGMNINCSSAGIAVYPYSEVSRNSVEAMRDYDVDISSHSPTQVNENIIEQSDLILTMTESHSSILKNAVPGASDRIHSLASYTQTSDIPDPYGGDINEYKACAVKIKEALIKLCERLKNE